MRPLSARLRATAIVLMAALPLAACGGGSKDRPKADLAAAKITTIGVNSYLWRASLETLSFMPLVQTDSNGGVIVTDWYTNPNSQVNQGGQWVDAPLQAATVQKLEEIILTKARDLRRMAITSQ